MLRTIANLATLKTANHKKASKQSYEKGNQGQLVSLSMMKNLFIPFSLGLNTMLKVASKQGLNLSFGT